MKPPILISYPCHDMVHSDFTQCLSMLSLFSVMRAGIEIGISQTRTSIICSGRNMQVEQFLTAAQPFSHLFFLDSDMTFPYDALARLLAHNRPVVGASYCMRQSPRCMTHRDGSFGSALPAVGQYPENLYPVLSMGMGCVLVRRDVLEALATEDLPFFQVHYEGRKLKGGEDVTFFRRINKAGIPVVCDIALTYEMGHVGQKQYTTQDVEKVLDGKEPETIIGQLPGLLGKPTSER